MATYVLTGGTATAPKTPADITNIGSTLYANVFVINNGNVLQIGDGTTETHFDDTGWVILVEYNSHISIKANSTWVSGRSQNNYDVEPARWIMGYGVKCIADSSTLITLQWHGIKFIWHAGSASNDTLELHDLNANSYLNIVMGVEYNCTASKLLFTTQNITYVGLTLQNTIVRSDYSGTQFDSLIMNGRDTSNEDSAQFYGNTTELTVNKFAPIAPTPMVGSIYGGYTNNALKNFYLNNPSFDATKLLFYAKNFYIHINLDFIFNVDVAGCNIGLYCGAAALQAETTYNFRVNDIWLGYRTTEEDAYRLPDQVWDNTNTIFKVRKYGYYFNEYQEVVPIAGEYVKTLFMKPRTDITMPEADALNVTGVVLQSSSDVDYVWELDCGGNTLEDVYHYIQATLVSSGTLGGVDTFALNDFLLRDGTKFKTIQIRLNEGVKLINYGSGKISSFQKDDGTLYVPPVTVAFSLSGLQPNSEVRIYQSSDMTELAGIEDSSTSFGYNYEWSADIPVIVAIFNVKYDPIRFETTLTSSDTTIPIQQIFDRNYSNPA